MVTLPTGDLTLVGVLTPLAQIAMFGLLGLEFVAGNTDQREENQNMANDFMRQFRA